MIWALQNTWVETPNPIIPTRHSPLLAPHIIWPQKLLWAKGIPIMWTFGPWVSSFMSNLFKFFNLIKIWIKTKFKVFVGLCAFWRRCRRTQPHLQRYCLERSRLSRILQRQVCPKIDRAAFESISRKTLLKWFFYSGSISELKNNPWFGNFDWVRLDKRDMKAPYIPHKSQLITQSLIDSQLEQNINF